MNTAKLEKYSGDIRTSFVSGSFVVSVAIAIIIIIISVIIITPPGMV
ncbi:MAG: hypothetical protein IKA32_05560 [Lentisphaeria bacterium]|nr:hypothetical protein [Lentisphaeria bacterium]